DPLGRDDVAALLASRLGAPPEPDVLDEIWRRSEGNPFFVEELAAAARSGHPPTATLEPILTARLGALSAGATAVAAAVSAAAGPVRHRVLAEVAGLDERALLDGLRECVDHHVLVADARAGTYAFRHSLLRDAAYAALLPGGYGRVLSAALSDDVSRHGTPRIEPVGTSTAVETGRIFPAAGADRNEAGPTLGAGPDEAIAAGRAQAADLAALSWHLYAAGDAEAALPAALAAGLEAEAAGGYAEAHVQYERALELAARLPAAALESAFLTATRARSGLPVAGNGPSGAANPAPVTTANPAPVTTANPAPVTTA